MDFRLVGNSEETIKIYMCADDWAAAETFKLYS